VDLIARHATLQKRLIGKTEEVVERDLVIAERDRLVGELRARLASAPGAEVVEQLTAAQHALAERTRQLKSLASEANMFQTQASEARFEAERMARELQEAIRRAGREAAAFGRQTESGEDSQKITALEQAGRLRRVAFTERAQMNAAVQPVMAAYAREIDAEGIHNRIASMTS
jgi:hypothetical protein